MSDILSKYDTSLDGLDQNEAQKRQEKYGLNEIIEKKPTPLIVLFLSQFVDILIGLLIVAAIASFAIGDIIDAGVIILAVLLNVIMGFIQEYRSQKAVESLKGLITKHAIVKRNNQVHEIDAKSTASLPASCLCTGSRAFRLHAGCGRGFCSPRIGRVLSHIGI